MIAPDVEVLGVGSEGYAWLCDRVAARQSIQGDWLWGRHDGQRLLSLVPELGAGDRLQDIDLSDPTRVAAELRSSRGLARVVLIDDRQRAVLAQRLDQAAAPGITQWAFFRACQRAFWDSPAVATDPAPPSDRWDAVADALREAGDCDLVLLVLDAGALFLGLRATIRGGLMVSLAGALPEETDASRDVAGLLAQVDAVGRADIALVCTLTALEAALGSADLVAAMVAVAASPDAIHVRGFERLGNLQKVGVAS